MSNTYLLSTCPVHKVLSKAPWDTGEQTSQHTDDAVGKLSSAHDPAQGGHGGLGGPDQEKSTFQGGTRVRHSHGGNDLWPGPRSLGESGQVEMEE